MFSVEATPGAFKPTKACNVEWLALQPQNCMALSTQIFPKECAWSWCCSRHFPLWQWNGCLPAAKKQGTNQLKRRRAKLNDVSHQSNHVLDSHYHRVVNRCYACVCHNLEHSICYVFFSWIGSSVGTHVNCLSRVGSTSFFSRFWSIFLLAAKTYAMLLFINQQALLFVAWRQNNNTATTTISVVYVFNEKTETPKHRN